MHVNLGSLQSALPVLMAMVLETMIAFPVTIYNVLFVQLIQMFVQHVILG